MSASGALLPRFVAEARVRVAGTAGESQVPAALPGAVPARQREFAAGRACAALALRRLGAPEGLPPVGLARGGGPLWPAGIVGSITHAGGWAWAAVARAGDAATLGIDLEPVLADARARRLSSEIATAGELAGVRCATGLPLPHAVTLVFSAKESLFKALHPLTGRSAHHYDARVGRVDVNAGRFRVRLATSWSADWPAGAELEGGFRFRGGCVETALMWTPMLGPANGTPATAGRTNQFTSAP
jgi:enterobactin synthetase component D